MHHAGTFQEYYAVNEDCLWPVPDEISDEAAASFWINPVSFVYCCVPKQTPLVLPGNHANVSQNS